MKKTGTFYYSGLLLALFCFATLQINAQKVSLEWAKGIGGEGLDVGNKLVVDAEGNVYTAGSFRGTVDFDPDSIATNTFTTMGAQDAFVLKLSSAGKLIWARQFASNGSSDAWDLNLDNNGNLVISGQFTGTCDFDPGADTFNLQFIGGLDAFILKLDTSGNFVWAKSLGGSKNEASYALTTDRQGNIYLTGVFRGTVDFDPGAGVTNLTAPNSDIYVLKLNSNGDFVWASQYLGIRISNAGTSINLDHEGNIYVGGRKSMASTGGLIWKLDKMGNSLWEYTFDGSGVDEVTALAIDSKGNLYATGFFSDTVNFNSTGVSVMLGSTGGSDAFVLKLDTDGKFGWVKQFGNSRDLDITSDLKLDHSGNLLITGIFGETVDFDPGPGTYNLTANGSGLNKSDVYVLKLNAAGTFMDAYSFRSDVHDNSRGIAVDLHGTVYICGANGPFELSGSLTDFDPGPGTYNISNKGMGDIYIAKLICSDTNNTAISAEFCDSFTLNGVWYTEAGTYKQYIPNIMGCDSIINLELSFTKLTPIIRISVFELSTQQAYSSYQWFLNGQMIPGATERNYTVTQNGSYAVEVTNGKGCSGTSEDYVISNVSITDEAIAKANIRIYPNPATNKIFLQKPKGYLVSLWSIDGRQLRTPSTQNELSLATLATGTYWLKITDIKGNRIQTEQIAKIGY